MGDYKLDVTLSGFKSFSQTGIRIEVGRNARIDATLEAGGVEETISVIADAHARRDELVRALANRGPERGAEPAARQPRPLLAAQHHRRRQQQRRRRTRWARPEQLTTINGSTRAQIGSVNFQLDGGNNTAGLRGTGNTAPNPEAVQEFRVITNSYAAEYGRYQAGIVDMVTKSGTNQLPRRRLRVLPRREPERGALGAARESTPSKDPLDRDQFGAAFGGPIQKDKTFFFASYSGLRQEGTYYRNTAVVPTALERAGDFSQSAIKPRDPATGQPFPGGIIPARALRRRRP